MYGPHLNQFCTAGGLVNPAYESHGGDGGDDGFTDSDAEDASEPTEVEKVIDAIMVVDTNFRPLF